ncbi:MAG: PDZ domain-containing protein [Acidobacteria bacterium]|nr:MAG: PDZ domain-containing protein [Acidobacteriota bacterium]
MQRIRYGAIFLTFVLGTGVGVAQEPEDEHDGAHYTFRWHDAGRGFIGVQVTPMTSELRVHFGAPEAVGVLVSRVDESSPAEAAGIQVGDVLSAVDGEAIESGRKLSRYIRKKDEGDVVTIELYRNGGLESYPVTIAKRERRALDFAGGFRFFGGEDEDADHEVFIATPGLHLDGESFEAFREAMKGLKHRFESEEWQERLKRFRNLDFGAIQERMEEVEERLKELEEELAEAGKRKF